MSVFMFSPLVLFEAACSCAFSSELGPKRNATSKTGRGEVGAEEAYRGRPGIHLQILIIFVESDRNLPGMAIREIRLYDEPSSPY
jgi:hypothetical protein